MSIAASPASRSRGNPQSLASDPAASAWVTANAGSGKTHVLVNRVIRLLLAGCPPEKILCLTFTRAAAAEMSNRLFNELAGWIALDDAKLVDSIRENTVHGEFQADDLLQARRLFTRALETPGGLKVQTIHAFCEKLLQRFPIEAGAVPGFEVMTEDTSREMLSTARSRVLARACADTGGHLAAALDTVVAYATSDSFDRLLARLLDKRAVLTALSLRDRGEISEAVSTLLGHRKGDDAASLATEAQKGLEPERYRAAAEALAQSGARTDLGQAQLINDTLKETGAANVFAGLKQLFVKKDGDAKAASSVLTRRLATQQPELADFLYAEQERILALVERERAARSHAATVALLALGTEINAVYEDLKLTSGRYDYDDLIDRARELLLRREGAAWVLFKLDGGLDHILIDEAQDTSPQQWEIVAALAAEFFAGETARSDNERTVFAVGDRKQSIFSFQGADPRAFDEMLDHFRQQAEEARRRFEAVPLTMSFRSAPQVLEAIDKVFAQDGLAPGLRNPGEPPAAHAAHRAGQAGLVEIWPTEKPRKRDKPELWRAPREDERDFHPRIVLARGIAATIRQWIDDREQLQPRGRPIRYDDILILVRRRTTFMDALVRALKQRSIPVAGADRLVLTKHIAVQDLLALGRFVLLPEDELTLACVLKSPLLARDDGEPIDDDDLLSLARGREERNLWQRLEEAVAAGQPYGDALGLLKRWRARTGFVPVYEFYSEILAADGRRTALMARLGTEAAEPIDAFLSRALDFEQENPPGLHGFIASLEDSDAQIKRDMDHGGNEVRIMTVHGAKGLEANIVILPDTCELPDGRNEPDILYSDAARDALQLPVWKLRREFRPDSLGRLRAAWREQSLEEYNRLLYVAMTRARDRLYICGYQSSETLRPDCWYQQVSNVLATQDTEVLNADGNVKCWRIRGEQTGDVKDNPSQANPSADPLAPPDWALRAPAPERGPLQWLTPSRLLGPDEEAAPADGLQPGETVTSPLAGAGAERFRRGNQIHLLLQILPDFPEADREGAAMRFLQRASRKLAPEEAAEITAEVMRILQDSRFAHVFGPGSRAEVPIAALFDGPQSATVGVTGQIDRLIVSEREITIVDYKTNRPPPRRAEDVQALYKRQLAAYRRALQQIFPEHLIRACLLWTDGPTMMEIPQAMLNDVFKPA